MGAAIVGLIGIISLSGCATVSVQARVIDQTHASFAIQKVVTIDGYKQYLTYEAEQDAKNTEPLANESGLLDLDGRWIETTADPKGSHQEIVIGDKTQIFTVQGDTQTLFWQGTYTKQTIPATVQTWKSEKIDDPTTQSDNAAPAANYLFSYESGEISYNALTDQSQAVAIHFTKVPDTSEEATTPKVATPKPITLSKSELCTSFKKDVAKFDPDVAKIKATTVECTDVDFAVTTIYDVGFGYGGITSLNGKDISSKDRDALSFKFYPDTQYGDIVFETRILGLLDGQFPSSQSWLEGISSYKVSVTFPGKISGYNGESSGATDDGHTVTWGNDTIRKAVENNVFTLKAAGVASGSADPMPYIISFVGGALLLLILLYFSWKRISPRKIAIISLFLTLVSPFGLGMAIIARKKARNDAEGKKLAFISIGLNSCILVFEVLFVGLAIFLAPQLLTEFWALFGL